MSSTPDGLDRLDKELSGFRSWPRIDPGPSAMVVSIGVLLVLVAHALPWTGSASGWNVLLGDAQLGLLPRLFSITSLLFGVLGSTTGILTRLWGIGWTCALGCGFSVVNGLWAIWSRQTAPAGSPGPGIGLLLAVLAMALLALMWVRLAWSRPGGRANG
ncbi:MAG TPA: hypothetical protein VK735_01645 [Pseudonocardia sp.]|jgi:hypothetical protein|uniref:Rv2732c family membrane protein n=1 Tax=Pseudonocardia sp. TaxID=60912 RepID=UPI002C7BC0BF|nr:hypothetical protein [Pseudonocardia sp.]HTF46129.1 hypothetical protein [Pseudonocardia sp.]